LSVTVLLLLFFPQLSVADITANRVASVSKYSMDSCADRQQPGFICMNCEILATCLYRNNTWETIPLEVCDPDQGLYCNVRNHSCENWSKFLVQQTWFSCPPYRFCGGGTVQPCRANGKFCLHFGRNVPRPLRLPKVPPVLPKR